MAGAETHRVRLGYGWKTGPTGGPYLSAKRGTGPALSVATARRARASAVGLRCLGRKPGTGPRREEGGRVRKEAAGEKEEWAEPESGEGERKIFSIF